jgi:tRNA nucleotidyltransferase (CCA-adding enzyme)
MSSLADLLLSKTRAAAAIFPQTRGVLLGGSYAKGTWLAGHVDLDIFVKIDPSTPEAEFEKIGLSIGAKATKGHPTGKMFAQHPYTEATVDGVRVNIVPCYDVKPGEWKSAADRSPFHVRLVESLSDEKKTQVRLLKMFMDAVGVYGAEIERQGFSGYVAEVLVMKHGDLLTVLRWFADHMAIADSRPFSLADPTDESRDLGTAVSRQSLGRMILACREFLSHPATAFFHKMSGKSRPSVRKGVVAITLSHRALSEDTLWGELRRTTKRIATHAEAYGFAIARSMAASNNRDRSAILLIPEFAELPATEQRVGPTVDRQNDVHAFIKSNAKEGKLVWVDDDARVRILRPRKYVRLSALLADMAKGRAGPTGISKELEVGLEKSGRVLQGAPLARAAASAKWLEDGIREITSDAIGAR